MARTTAERQAAYRVRRSQAGERGDGERRLNTWIRTGAALALARLANRYGVTQRVMLERFIMAEDERVLVAMEPGSPEWEAYFQPR